MDNQKATWHKEIGGYRGAVKVGGRWIGFRCLFCAEDAYMAKFRGPDAQRWQGPASPAMDKAMENLDAIPCQGAAAHRKHLAAQMKGAR